MSGTIHKATAVGMSELSLFMYDSLGLREAAAFLKVRPDWLAQEANAGRIKGGKPRGRGGCWVFLRFELIEYIKSTYAEEIPCLSRNAAKFGVFTSSPRMVKKLESVLAQKTVRPHKNSMMT